jgi:L-ribulose-5-phosphate 3-epimerase
MILAGHTMGTPEYSVPEALDLFARIGLGAAEVIWQDGYRCGIDPRADAATLRALAAHAWRAGTPIVALTPYENRFNSLDPTERTQAVEAYARALAAAEPLGASWLRLYGGRWLPGDTDRDVKWARLVDALRTLGDGAREHGVTICVENHFNTMTDTAAHTAALVREVDHPHVRVLYDQANLGFIQAEGWEDALRLCRGTIAYVHVKDFVFKGDHRTFVAGDVSHVEEDVRIVRSRVVGEGVLPWPDILGALRASGYDGVLSLEYERRWHPDDLPPAEDGMARSAAQVRAWLQA